jgi:SPP1 gp7 family putative phage head morphogenesis protein
MLNGLFNRFKRTNNQVIDFQESKPEVNLRELTYSGVLDEYMQYMDDYSLNPDDLIAEKGWDYVKAMADDDTIHSCLEIKKTGRLSTEWDIKEASESQEDKKVAAYVRYCFKRMDGNFNDNLKDILSGLEFGHSCSEMNYLRYPDGEWKNYIGLKSIKTRDPKHIRYKFDKHGNIIDVIQKADYIMGLKEDIHIPRDKCIIYTPNKLFSNPYGEPELKYVFKPYLAKKWVVRFWNIALERYGAGLVIGTYNIGREGQKEYLEKVLKNLQAKTEIVKPAGIEIDVQNPMVGGKMAYEFALEKHETAIARALLIPDLIGFSKFTKGSFALGQKHFDVFLWVLKKLGRDIEETIVDEQIIRHLVKINFGDNVPIPHFKFVPLTEEDKTEYLQRIEGMAKTGIVNMTPEDEVYLRNYMGMPKRELEDIVADKEEKEKKAEEIRQQMQKNAEENEVEDEDEEQRDGENYTEHRITVENKLNRDIANGKLKRPEKCQICGKTNGKIYAHHPNYNKSKKVIWVCPSCHNLIHANNLRNETSVKVIKNVLKKKNKFAESKAKSYLAYKTFKFKELGDFWDNIEDNAIAELRNIFRKTKNSFMDRLERKGYLNVDNPVNSAEVKKLKLNYTGEIKKTLTNVMTLGYLHSKAVTINEMRAVNDVVKNIFKKDISLPEYNLSKVNFQEELDPQFNLKAEKAIEHLEKKIPVKKSELLFYQRKAYTITGVESEEILGSAKNIIYKHLQTGDKKRTKKAFEKLWDKYEQTGKITDKGKLSTAYRLETIVRTNVGEAMSEGRRAMYEDPQIADEIVAYTVSAILDSSTTEYCAGIDGLTFSKEEFNFPPYHFNCRTVALPVYRGEEHTLKSWKESPYEFY